jgi:hypothetical protein
MILRNGKVFLSHTAEDAGLYAPLVARLNEKQVDYWTTIQPGDNDTQLSPQTLKEIGGRDVFLRICTPAAARSARMRQEAAAFRSTQEKDIQNGTPNQHIIIDLVMDPAYISDPADTAYLTIDTTTRPMNDGLVVLYNEMGSMQATSTMSRRTLSILIVVGVVFLLALTLIIFALLIRTS